MERRMMREKVGSKIACSSENGDRKEREWILTLESEWGGGLQPERRNKPKLMQFYCAERERDVRFGFVTTSYALLHLLLFFFGPTASSPYAVVFHRSPQQITFFFMTPQQIIFFLI